MTSAYTDAVAMVAQSSSYYLWNYEQIQQAIQFRALDIEIDRAEVDLAIRQAVGDWPICGCPMGPKNHRHYYK